MGVTGMKSLGVRELTYKLCFAACYTMVRHSTYADCAATLQHSCCGQRHSLPNL